MALPAKIQRGFVDPLDMIGREFDTALNRFFSQQGDGGRQFLAPYGVDVREVGDTKCASFRLGCTPRWRKGDTWVDGQTSWFTVNCWRGLGRKNRRRRRKSHCKHDSFHTPLHPSGAYSAPPVAPMNGMKSFHRSNQRFGRKHYVSIIGLLTMLRQHPLQSLGVFYAASSAQLRAALSWVVRRSSGLCTIP